MPSPETLERFIARVESNAHAEAVEEFYADNATMQENQDPPRVGRANHVAREKMVIARTQSMRSQCVRPVFVNGEHVVIHWTFQFVWKDGTFMHMDELALQRWEGERIVEEVFYYDPAQRAARPVES
jgi:ketosteroid isomerase-like protein